MKKLLTFLLLAAVLALSLTACKTDSGSREFAPGKGWQPTK